MWLQAFDEGPWPRMTGRQRGRLLSRLADLMEVYILVFSHAMLLLPP